MTDDDLRYLHQPGMLMFQCVHCGMIRPHSFRVRATVAEAKARFISEHAPVCLTMKKPDKPSPKPKADSSPDCTVSRSSDGSTSNGGH